MTSKHTPGPWRLDDPINESLIEERYHFIEAGRGISSQGFSIAGVLSLADARLIAAAPELLEMLQRVLDSSCGLDEALVNDAHELIAKARGES